MSIETKTEAEFDDAIAAIESRVDRAQSDRVDFPRAGLEPSFVLQRSKNVEDWDGDNSVTKV
ncbi:hypothetical protein [Euzebya rosea]|uniref:hypothetical protein n=1 Tax=Euzebya rosea TaxID=2052804 RepID=UPI00130095F6|nr:hypothetical protein [Euzebya rosea]